MEKLVVMMEAAFANVMRPVALAPDALPANKKKEEGPGVFEQLGAALGAVTGTIGAVVGGLQGIVGVAVKFVDAFAPAAVLVFNQALYDITAVIGQALVPIVYGAADAIKMVGAVLMPVMRSLTPIVSRLTGVFLQWVESAMPAFEALTEIVVMIADAFVTFLEIWMPIINAMQILGAVMWDLLKALVSWLASLFGGDVVNTLKSATQTIAKYMLLAAGAVAKFIGSIFGVAGGGMVMESLLKATNPEKEKKGDITGFGAAKDAKFQSFSDYGRAVTTASLLAGSGATPTKTDNQWLADTYEMLKALEKNGKFTIQQLKEFVGEKFDELIEAVKGEVKALPFAAVKSILPAWAVPTFEQGSAK